jgi:DNA repair protein RecO (recombination protein O)
MTENATGIILRTRPLTDTSLIVHWLTTDLGRISTVAKGARRPLSPFRGKLDLFYLADFSFARSRRSDLHTLREVSLRDSQTPIRQEIKLLQRVSYAAALIEQTTEVETPLPAVFQLLGGFLEAVTVKTAQANVVFAFELKLLEELGLSPELRQSKLSPGAREIATKLLASEFAFVPRIQLSRAQINELTQFLNSLLIFHFGRVPSSRAAALGE